MAIPVNCIDFKVKTHLNHKRITKFKLNTNECFGDKR